MLDPRARGRRGFKQFNDLEMVRCADHLIPSDYSMQHVAGGMCLGQSNGQLTTSGQQLPATKQACSVRNAQFYKFNTSRRFEGLSFLLSARRLPDWTLSGLGRRRQQWSAMRSSTATPMAQPTARMAMRLQGQSAQRVVSSDLSRCGAASGSSWKWQRSCRQCWRGRSTTTAAFIYHVADGRFESACACSLWD